MTRSRALRGYTLPVLALVAAISVSPRAVLFTHHHAGGDHEHVHVWGEDAFAHHHHGADHDDDAVEPHHHHDHADTGEVELEAPDGDGAHHVHVQLPFQLALRPSATMLVVGLLVRPVVAAARASHGVAPAPATIARGPPSVLA